MSRKNTKRKWKLWASSPYDRSKTSHKVSKVLASDTRISILEMLVSRRMTLTEMSKKLDVPKSTVHRNLIVLTSLHLIRKNNEERKWVYYDLMKEGERLIISIETLYINL